MRPGSAWTRSAPTRSCPPRGLANEFRTKGLLGRPRGTSLVEPGTRLILGRAFLWIELRLIDEHERILERTALSYALFPDFDQLRALLGAEDGDHFGALELILGVLGRLGHAPVATTSGPSRL
jgi:hypothetical protein